MKYVETLTGHVKSNGNLMGLVKLGIATLGLRLTMFSPRTGVTTSPYVHGVVVSIFTWYCFKQTLNLVLQTPEHSPVLEVLPEQHLPRLSFPYSFTNDFNLNSNTPEAFTWKQIGFYSIKIPSNEQSFSYFYSKSISVAYQLSCNYPIFLYIFIYSKYTFDVYFVIRWNTMSSITFHLQ